MRIVPAGDRALVADFGNVISEDVNRKVNALKKSLLVEKTAGVREMIPTYRSLLVEYDPAVISMQELSRRIEAASLGGAQAEAAFPGTPPLTGGEITAQPALISSAALARSLP